LTEILKPGPISKGVFENNARLATAFELMEDNSEFSSDIPSPVEDVLWLKLSEQVHLDQLVIPGK
jgi:hypothetical protein